MLTDATLPYQIQMRPGSPSHLARPHSPRSALAATYSTYVVRVHTRHGIKTISFDVLAAFFTYTAKKAAEDLGISSRTLIRVCRSLGIRRWPYLGFRSEKNVERIRQEAIENLRRKLERDGADAASPTLHPSSSCLRGASAKRLLQVKTSPPTLRTELPGAADFAGYNQSRLSPSLPSPPQYALLTPPPTNNAFNLESASISPRRPLPSLHLPSIAHHTTQPTRPALLLSQSLKTAPLVAPISQLAFPRPSSAPTSVASSPTSGSSAPSSPSSRSSMPSLNVLVDASILTAFKNEVESHISRPGDNSGRSMSMRDILSHSTTATAA
ncbi:hypothetical protein ATCC90586_004490 [Pythium insidiosum]|nr:hypothetical protein ATCC90586_004490 [Pythium insidiosum]